MKFSTRTSYALRALICLAKADGNHLSVAAIAESERLPAKYLEAIFADLKRAKVVVSSQGTRGGYRLAKQPGTLSVLTIVSALENPTQTLYCLSKQGKKYCAADCQCGVKKVVNKLNQSITQTLGKVKLTELIN
jgi:Rrf2 family protein